MKPSDLNLRCYAEQEPDNTWYAVCVDLNLFAEGDTRDEVVQKLHRMVSDYVYEAFTTDKEYFTDLIPRSAPLSFVIRYCWLKLLTKLHKAMQPITNAPLSVQDYSICRYNPCK